MKSLFLMLALLTASAAHGDDGTERYGNLPPGASILIINGQAYTVPANSGANLQQSQEDEQQGAINPRTGQYYPPVGAGVLNPSTGMVYPDVGAGYINPRTGQFIPKQ